MSVIFAIPILSFNIAVAEVGETPPPYVDFYNPNKGFKPAQADFTEIFLQLAGSLEHHGTPEPYIRHVLGEHGRIAAKYKAATGKNSSSRPKYLTDEYVENLLRNWRKLEVGLKLETLSRQSGRNMRLAIKGSWNMSIPELVALETTLTPAEAISYGKLLAKSYFTKADTAAVDAFYSAPYDELSDTGKSQLSKRVWRGALAPDKRDASIQGEKGGSFAVEILNDHHKKLITYLKTDSTAVVNSDNMVNALKVGLNLSQDNPDLAGMPLEKTDALKYSHQIKSDIDKRIQFLQAQVPDKKDATNMEAAIYSMVENLAVIAHSEFRAALLELPNN